MTPRWRPLLVVPSVLVSALSLAACTSPEATRMRGGGPGADLHNRTEVVQTHEGAQPYHETPRLIAPYGLEERRAKQ